MSAPAAGVITLRDLRSLGCTVEDAPAIERTASVQETVQEGREIQEVGPSQSRKLPGAKLAGRFWPGHRRTGSRARSDSVNRITRSNSTDACVLTRLCRFLGVHAAVFSPGGAESFLRKRERG